LSNISGPVNAAVAFPPSRLLPSWLESCPSLVAMGARTYKDLDVWKIADELRTAIRLMVRRPSFDRHEWLRLQLRRAANSGCTNTAEGFG
jgi:hypothetical protein